MLECFIALTFSVLKDASVQNAKIVLFIGINPPCKQEIINTQLLRLQKKTHHVKKKVYFCIIIPTNTLIMKKTILTLLVVSSIFHLSTLCAQDFHFQMGEKTNKKAYNASLIHIAEGMQEGQLLVVEPVLKAISGPFSNPVKSIKVRLCDIEWNETKSVTLDNTKKNTIFEAFRIVDRLHVLLGSTEDNTLTLRHVVLDAQSLDIVSDKLLVDSPLPKGSEPYIWTVSSPNGQYRGVVYAIWENDNNGKAVAMLFDREMNKLQEHPLPYSDVSEVIATDDGILATALLGMPKDNKKATVFRINTVSADGERHGEFMLDADLSDMALLNCDGSRILAVALEGKGGNGTIRLGTLGSRIHTGIYGLVFDLDKQQISVANQHPFTDEELRLLSNDDKGETYSDHEIKFMNKVDKCQTPQGGAVLYQHAWSVMTQNMKSGMTSETIYCLGNLLVQATMDGTLTISGIPQDNQYAKWPNVGSDLIAHNGTLYVITNESKEASDIYTPDEPAQRSKSLIFSNSAIAVYWFTPDGHGAKKVIEKDHKAVLATPLSQGKEGRFHFLVLGGIYPNICTLTLPMGR